MPDDTILEPDYPGDANMHIAGVRAIADLVVGKQAVIEIDLAWDHAGFPPYPVAAVTAEFLPDDNSSLFPTAAGRTDLQFLDANKRILTLSVKHIFDAAGMYYVRVTFAGHQDIAPAEYDANGVAVKVTIAP